MTDPGEEVKDLLIAESKGRCTLDATMANDIVPKKYQIGTKICSIFFFEGVGGGGGGTGGWSMEICTLNLEKCTDSAVALRK